MTEHEILPISSRYHDEKPGNILTVSGQWFDFEQYVYSDIGGYGTRLPTPKSMDQIDLFDIAHALARICRYGGHVASFYSVAEHCINVGRQLLRTYGDKDVALAGLLHDAHEAYLGDMVGPLKRRFPNLEAFEHGIDLAIQSKWALKVNLNDPRVKDVDRGILPWEMAMIRHDAKRTVDFHSVRNEYLNLAHEWSDRRIGWTGTVAL